MKRLVKSKAFLKTVSWLVVSGVIIAIPTYLKTNSFVTALEVAGAACVLKTPVYWLHEVVWHRNKNKKVELCPACAAV